MHAFSRCVIPAVQMRAAVWCMELWLLFFGFTILLLYCLGGAQPCSVDVFVFCLEDTFWTLISLRVTLRTPAPMGAQFCILQPGLWEPLGVRLMPGEPLVTLDKDTSQLCAHWKEGICCRMKTGGDGTCLVLHHHPDRGNARQSPIYVTSSESKFKWNSWNTIRVSLISAYREGVQVYLRQIDKQTKPAVMLQRSLMRELNFWASVSLAFSG